MAKGSKDRAARHEFARTYLKKTYGHTQERDQHEVVYKLKGGRKVMILAGQTETGFQAIRAANFDMLSKNDVIIVYNVASGIAIPFFKHELFELLEAGYIHWASTYSGEKTSSVTRILVQVMTDGSENYLYFSSVGSNSITIKARDMLKRQAKSGDDIGRQNLLFDGITLLRERTNK